jgi:plasmid replication initiation protein
MLLGYVLKTGRVDAGEYVIINAKYSVFSVCRLAERKSDGKRVLEFKCSEDVKPLIFEMQSKFTMSNVWNVLNLSNFQDIRMYMLLSQYKVAGSKTFTLEELKDKLGINREAYPEFKIFSRAVLKKCQKALKERTDICFEFKAVGRPAHSVLFDISANKEYKILKYLEEVADPKQLYQGDSACDNEQMSIEDVLEDEEREESENTRRQDLCEGFQDSLYKEFSYEQLVELYELAGEHVDPKRVEELKYGGVFGASEAQQRAVEEYIRRKILYCNSYADPVPHRFKFIRKAVAEDWR